MFFMILCKDSYRFLPLPGNCPLMQALPRAEAIWKNSKVETVLSISPPRGNPSKKVEELNKQWKKSRADLRYLVDQLTDGDAIYEIAAKSFSDVFFQRHSGHV